MESKVFGDILVCTYDSKEERNKHIEEMCTDKVMSILIYSNNGKLTAEFREVK